ncbi:MAG: CarD family transcriptional regulator [Alphaproteobacteria bacterium]|nr:CarD family transcriptional regulator [Alphaproteobacteria bacterium]
MKVAPPVQKAKPAPQVQKAAPAPAAAAPVAAPVAKKPEKLDFTTGDFVVYPAHGVGYVEGVETTTIAGMEITLYTICFEKDRMRLKLPISKVKSSGLRKLSSKDRLKDALATLQGRSQTRRVMWSRRAQEYEAKINSGDPVAIAEVLRDLRKDTDESEQSYSERQIYQAALERLAREVAAIEKIDEKKAAEKLEAVLSNVA